MTTLWAWIASPGDDRPEYLVGMGVAGSDRAMPMISSNKKVARQLEPIARGHAKVAGVSVRLARFEEVYDDG